MGFWSYSLWRVVTAENSGQAMLFQQLFDLSAIFIPIFYFQFIITLLKLNDKKRELVLMYFCGLALVALSFFTGFKSGVAPMYDFNYWVKAGPVYFIFPLYFSLLMFYAFYLQVINLNKHGVITRNQIKSILLAGVIGYVGVISDFFPQLINIYPVGNYFVIFYIAVAGFAIVRYRLLGIRMIASRLYTYCLLAAFAYAFFYFVILSEEILFGSLYQPGALIIGPLESILFAVLLVPLFDRIQKSGDILFYSGYNPRRIIKDLSVKLSSVIDLDELINSLNEEFKKILAAEKIEVYIFARDKRERADVCFRLGNKTYKRIEIGERLKESFAAEKRIIVLDEEERAGRKKMARELERLKAKVIAPLSIRSHVTGFILLKEKMNGGFYSQEDIDFLEIISAQAAVAIENAYLYQEVADFNQNLQQKVDEQTKELKGTAEHLKKLMEMRSEFLDITSHQLRTPVSVIKGVLSMLEENSVPEEKRKEFIRGALEKAIKLGETINDILRASEMDTDRFTIRLQPVDLNELMKKVESEKMRSANTRKIQLNFVYPPEPLPPVYSDERYLEQALVNLINNSLQYTMKGSITVSLTVERETVVIRVADTGIGIPRKDLAKLFHKFGRAENAVVTFTDGSGLGLYIIKKIVDANPGAKIEIEKTDVNKGTTFALTLPIYFDRLMPTNAQSMVAKMINK
jgi:signal transduction histidine kinase